MHLYVEAVNFGDEFGNNLTPDASDIGNAIASHRNALAAALVLAGGVILWLNTANCATLQQLQKLLNMTTCLSAKSS